MCIRDRHIIALVAVGSGAFGYIDGLSDLDMVVAVDSDENMEAVMKFVNSQLNKKLNFIYFKQALQRRLQVYLCDNYLEIDIGYGAYTLSLIHIFSLFSSFLMIISVKKRRWK